MMVLNLLWNQERILEFLQTQFWPHGMNVLPTFSELWAQQGFKTYWTDYLETILFSSFPETTFWATQSNLNLRSFFWFLIMFKSTCRSIFS